MLNVRVEATGSTLENALFWVASMEYSYGEIRQGLWRTALSLSNGDESKAKFEYLRLRVKTLHGDIETTQPELIDIEIDENDIKRFLSFRSAGHEREIIRINDLDEEHTSKLWRGGIVTLITIFVIVCGITLI